MKEPDPFEVVFGPVIHRNDVSLRLKGQYSEDEVNEWCRANSAEPFVILAFVYDQPPAFGSNPLVRIWFRSIVDADLFYMAWK